MKDFKNIQFDGIGTHFWIDLPKEISDRLVSEVEQKLLEILKDFDRKYSRFKETSLISELNTKKHLKNFPKELFEMLILSEEVRVLTDGHFNVCVGTQLENLGYDATYSFQSSGKLVDPTELKIEKLKVDEIKISENTRIDLGGIGKGWLIEKFVKELQKLGFKKFVVNGGGDVYVCDDENKEYEFALENPFNNNEMIGVIKISNEAIACSSPSRRKWRDRRTGNIHHHLIDFNSGKSANNIISVFTQSKSIVNSDLASTAIFVSETEKADKIAKKLGVEYLMVFPDGSFVVSDNYKGELNVS